MFTCGNTAKYLGMTQDTNLIWIEHVNIEKEGTKYFVPKNDSKMMMMMMKNDLLGWTVSLMSNTKACMDIDLWNPTMRPKKKIEQSNHTDVPK